MSTRKRLPDESIIAAIIEKGSIKAAADSLGIAVRTIYTRMRKPAFKRLYEEQKAEILKAGTAKLQSGLSRAVDTLMSVLGDPETAPQVRVNAANSILQFAAKYTEIADFATRLEALEKLTEERNEQEFKT